MGARKQEPKPADDDADIDIANGATGTGTQAQIRQVRKGSWSAAKRADFLATLAETANVTLAAGRSGVSPSYVYRKRRTDPALADAWDAALREGVQHLELRLLERALNGDRKPQYYGGKLCGETIEYPDRISMFLINRHGGPGGENIAENGTRRQLDAKRARQAQAREKLAAEVEKAARRLREGGS